MKFILRVENILISLTCVVCTLLILKLLYSLRTIFPWRVNCWFCNNNFWVKFFERNSWTCRKCDQYNGFTKDGDYNKPISANTNESSLKTPKVFQSSPPRNGLCKMCNINQQLKVAQLANFVPMNERNYDEEIESYRMQLEKAYKLCSPCKKVLQMKLHKEKEVLLGTKLLEARTPEKKAQKKEMENTKMLTFINRTYSWTATILMILISIESYTSVTKNEYLLSTVSNTKNILTEFLGRIALILKMKILQTFPAIEKYLIDVPQDINTEKISKHLHFNINTESLEKHSLFVHEAIGSMAIMMLFMEYYCNKSKSKSYILAETIWSIFMMTCGIQHAGTVDVMVISLIKLSCIVTVLLLNRRKSEKQTRKILTSPKNLKNLSNGSMKSMVEEQDSSMETDDDVSLSQFGLHNFSDSSNETVNVNTSLISGRAFTPRSENSSIWKKPKLNSTFCANAQIKTPSSVSEIVFAKPNYHQIKQEKSFQKYQNLTNDSDSELDESISSLCIGSPNKSKKNGSIFSLRKFTATPSFVAPTPMSQSRPLISPSKLGHSTSWVAGGYWGSEGERQTFTVNGSRSSSQSSGFESQASSNQRNIMSQPPSREESVCGEPDRSSVLSNRFQNCNMNGFVQSHFPQHEPQKFQSQTLSNFSAPTPSNFARQTPSNFSRINSPVFPQMQYNSHVHIPQPRFAQQTVANMFAQQQFNPGDLFKPPGGTGLIKLPQVKTFSSR